MSYFRLIKRIAHGKPEIDNTHQLYWEDEQKKLYVSADGVWYPIGTNLEKYIIRKTLTDFVDPNAIQNEINQRITDLTGQSQLTKPGVKQSYNSSTSVTQGSTFVMIQKHITNGVVTYDIPGFAANGTSKTTHNTGNRQFPNTTQMTNGGYYKNTTPPITDSNFTYNLNIDLDDGTVADNDWMVCIWFQYNGQYYFYYIGAYLSSLSPGTWSNTTFYTYNATSTTAAYKIRTAIHNAIQANYDSGFLDYYYRTIFDGTLPQSDDATTHFDLAFSEPKFRIRFENMGLNGTPGTTTDTQKNTLKVTAKFDDDANDGLSAIISQDITTATAFNNSVATSAQAAASASKFFRILESSKDKAFQSLSTNGFLVPHNFNQVLDTYVYFPEIYKHFRLTIFSLPRALESASTSAEKHLIIALEKTVLEEVVHDTDVWSVE
jgi:hypothetical protein